MKQARIKAILVDDERYALGNLAQLLHTYAPEITVCAQAQNVNEALACIKQHQPYLLFLDIQMPGESGFDLIEQLENPPLLVFVTAHDAYAIRALKYAAIDYLLKPIDIHELKQAVQKVKELLHLEKLHKANYPLMLRNFGSLLRRQSAPHTLTLPMNNGYEMVKLDAILYIQADDNYSRFFLLQQKQILVAKTLKEYDELLNLNGFLRIHKSTLVNLKHAQAILRKENHTLVMNNGDELAVSRRKLPELLDFMKAK